MSRVLVQPHEFILTESSKNGLSMQTRARVPNMSMWSAQKFSQMGVQRDYPILNHLSYLMVMDNVLWLQSTV